MPRITLLNCPVDVMTIEESVCLIGERIKANLFTQHVVVNVAKLVHMLEDQSLADSVKSCDIINIDGMGVVYGARFLGYHIPERVAGIDLFHKLLEHSVICDLPIFLLGATEEVVSKTEEVVRNKYPGLKVAGFHHGYFWDNEEAIVKKIADSGARLLFVAITSPKKENFINKWKDQLGVDFVMGVGGTFDVVAGKVKRAPVWMQNAGLEWFYRVLQEPGRMWKRYAVTNSKYLLLLAKEFWKVRVVKQRV